MKRLSIFDKICIISSSSFWLFVLISIISRGPVISVVIVFVVVYPSLYIYSIFIIIIIIYNLIYPLMIRRDDYLISVIISVSVILSYLLFLIIGFPLITNNLPQ